MSAATFSIASAGEVWPPCLLLRPTSNRRFIASHLPDVELRSGSIGDPESLRQAMAGVTHVIHCAGATKAGRLAEFYDTNQAGTRNVVSAVNAQAGQVQRVVHISSLAAAGPAVPEKPAREDDPPQPVSEYGKSKLAGEMEVTNPLPRRVCHSAATGGVWPARRGVPAAVPGGEAPPAAEA